MSHMTRCTILTGVVAVVAVVAALAAFTLPGCATSPLPRGCTPDDFAKESAACALRMRAGDATEQECLRLTDERETACQGAL